MGELFARFYRINGLVQGVGFRPTVYRIAKELHLNGTVFNDAEGVGVTLEGDKEAVLAFPDVLLKEKPPLARIDVIIPHECAPRGYTDFTITESQEGQVKTAITADAATCRACLEDMFTPGNRRYRYAFTNCTHCGPRFTITRHLPYDRPQTTMAPFIMCQDCHTEYTDPLDRRFHAQPNACPVCGPHLTFTRSNRIPIAGDPIDEAVKAIKAGFIVAVKGLGGFHLVCDAKNAKAVLELRRRKARDEKALAVMVANTPSARLFADISQAAQKVLESVARPIVLLPKNPNRELEGIAPQLSDIGLMLPYTPVHWLLFHSLAGKPDGADWTEKLALDEALVMTSGNRSGEPLVIDNDKAYEKLADIADFWLIHNRDILVRCDDSVVRLIGDSPIFIRRSRGYAPEALRFKDNFDATLAAGAYLKNTAALTRDNEVFLTQHIGDLENAATSAAFEEAIRHFEKLFEIKPNVYAADAHPDFASSRFAANEAQKNQASLFPIYHHAAHVGVAMAELQRHEPTLGLALDGVGLGPENEAWGSELLLVSAGHFARMGHLSPLPLPGGDRAALEPMRMAAAVLTLLGLEDEIVRRYPELPQAEHFGELVKNRRFSPLTTSLGRYFDAASSLLGLCHKQHDDARAAMLLESLAYRAKGVAHSDGFIFEDDRTVSLLPFMRFLATDGMKNPACAAADFHETLALALAALTQKAAQRIGYRGPVMLTGGCMANRLLTQVLTEKLHALGFQTYYPVKVPAGDGGLALGQVWLTHLAKKAGKDAIRYDGEL